MAPVGRFERLTNSNAHGFAGGWLPAGLAAPIHAADKSIFDLGATEAKQSWKDFKPAPAKIETNFGTLEFTGGGYPGKETALKVYDELDLQRATQLYLDLFPALSVHCILKSQVRDLGHRSSSDICVTPQKLNSTPLWLTGNTDSIYARMTLDLKADGPTVIEIPPNVMGPLDDAYFRFVVDFGATGPDKPAFRLKLGPILGHGGSYGENDRLNFIRNAGKARVANTSSTRRATRARCPTAILSPARPPIATGAWYGPTPM